MKNDTKICLDTLESVKALQDKGHVVWDSLGPVGIGWQTHKLSFVAVLATASMFLATDIVTDNECVLLGAQAEAVLTIFPYYVMARPFLRTGEFLYLGTCARYRIFRAGIKYDEFTVFNSVDRVEGKIVNGNQTHLNRACIEQNRMPDSRPD